MIKTPNLTKRIFELEEALIDIRDICERSSISGLKTGDKVFDIINKALRFTLLEAPTHKHLPLDPTEQAINDGCKAYAEAFLFTKNASFGDGIRAAYKAMIISSDKTEEE